MNSSAQIIWSMLFGAFGLGYFIYGRKQQKIIPLLAGIALFIFPYFISNTIVLVIVGCIILAIPYFIRS